MLVYSERYNTLWRSLMKLKQLILSSIAVGALAFTFGTAQPTSGYWHGESRSSYEP